MIGLLVAALVVWVIVFQITAENDKNFLKLLVEEEDFRRRKEAYDAFVAQDPFCQKILKEAAESKHELLREPYEKLFTKEALSSINAKLDNWLEGDLLWIESEKRFYYFLKQDSLDSLFKEVKP